MQTCGLIPLNLTVICFSEQCYEETPTCCFPRVDLQHKHKLTLHMWILCVSINLTSVLQHHEPEQLSCSFSRCLKSPLESLSMTVCQLSKSDLKHMSECQRLYQLKHLHFDDVVFPKSCSKSLRILLENVSDTLQTLQLENCRMNDSQLNVLLPALGQCSQLTSVNFYENDFSTAVMEDLLQCMANQSKLIVEHYPAPLECYDHEGYLILHRFSQLCRNLMDTLMARRQPKTITFATKTCRYCRSRCIYDKETRLCRCWQ